ncbi:MAG TPA: hypothetical protein VFK47_23335, partial [Ktedonobacteraceae bacterium]|nr:hypothetical protein [Ktedonobacteraceae bacterium]
MSETMHPNMNDENTPAPTPAPAPKEHGTMTSYIVGFILSLIFTVIPYSMVVHKTVSHNSLLVALLVFAVV